MDMTNPLWLRLNKQGCRWNRNPIGEIEAAGFQIDDVMSFKRFDTVMPAFPMRRVKAHKPRSGHRAPTQGRYPKAAVEPALSSTRIDIWSSPSMASS